MPKKTPESLVDTGADTTATLDSEVSQQAQKLLIEIKQHFFKQDFGQLKIIANKFGFKFNIANPLREKIFLELTIPGDSQETAARNIYSDQDFDQKEEAEEKAYNWLISQLTKLTKQQPN